MEILPNPFFVITILFPETWSRCPGPGPDGFCVQKNSRDRVPEVFADKKMIGTGSQ
jgi:hypothetical protein